jgi:hypothetical protein
MGLLEAREPSWATGTYWLREVWKVGMELMGYLFSREA